MNPISFLEALWDDIRGKDANGRNANFKKQYSAIVLLLSSLLAVGLTVLFPPWGAVSFLLPARKLHLHLTNNF